MYDSSASSRFLGGKLRIQTSRRRERATEFTVCSHCPRQGGTLAHRYAITLYATTVYAADIIILDYDYYFLYTGHIDVFCLTTY